MPLSCACIHIWKDACYVINISYLKDIFTKLVSMNAAQVAALAGVPRHVTERAHHKGALLERKLEAAFAAAQWQPLSAAEAALLRRLLAAAGGGRPQLGGAALAVGKLWREAQAAVVA